MSEHCGKGYSVCSSFVYSCTLRRLGMPPPVLKSCGDRRVPVTPGPPPLGARPPPRIFARNPGPAAAQACRSPPCPHAVPADPAWARPVRTDTPPQPGTTRRRHRRSRGGRHCGRTPPHVRRAEGGSDGGGRWGAGGGGGGGAAAISGRGPTWRSAAGAGRACARCWRWLLWRGWALRPR